MNKIRTTIEQKLDNYSHRVMRQRCAIIKTYMVGQFGLKTLETIANVKMNVEGMEKLIFTNVHFNMNVVLENDNERERKKATTVYMMAQKICPIRQSWGEVVPISFELNFK